MPSKLSRGKLFCSSLLVLAAGLASPAQALDYGLSLTSVIRHQTRDFEGTSELGHFVQRHGRAELESHIRGQGPLALFNHDENKIDESVPGVKPQGHSLLWLEARASNPAAAGAAAALIAHVDILIDDRVNGVPVQAALKYDAPMHFVRGDWNDFAAGRDVELEYTAAGWETAKNAVARFIVQTADQLRSNLDTRARVLGGSLSAIEVQRLDSAKPERMLGNRAKLSSELDQISVMGVCRLHLL
jgi:hypothetical protein